MSQKETGDWGDLVNGDHERDLGTHGRYTTLRAQLTAEGYIAISLTEGLRRIEAATERKPKDDPEERSAVSLALRKCGRKFQQVSLANTRKEPCCDAKT